jgi:transcriptional antiterminator NusG
MHPSIVDGAWIAVQVQTNMEYKVSAGLRERNYESFLPTYSSISRSSGKRLPTQLPLFRGYLFCRWAQSNSQRIVEIPAVIRVVGAGRTPVSVSDEDIAAIRRIVDSGLRTTPHCTLMVGERVVLSGGPLRGLRGIFIKKSTRASIVLNIPIMQRCVAVQVAEEHIVKYET